MNKSRFMVIFIFSHVAFIFLQIHKHTQFIKHSFVYQKNEKEHAQLLHTKELLTQQLFALQNHTTIKKYAQNKLKMRPISLHQIKKIKDNDQ